MKFQFYSAAVTAAAALVFMSIVTASPDSTSERSRRLREQSLWTWQKQMLHWLIKRNPSYHDSASLKMPSSTSSPQATGPQQQTHHGLHQSFSDLLRKEELTEGLYSGSKELTPDRLQFLGENSVVSELFARAGKTFTDMPTSSPALTGAPLAPPPGFPLAPSSEFPLAPSPELTPAPSPGFSTVTPPTIPVRPLPEFSPELTLAPSPEFPTRPPRPPRPSRPPPSRSPRPPPVRPQPEFSPELTLAPSPEDSTVLPPGPRPFPPGFGEPLALTGDTCFYDFQCKPSRKCLNAMGPCSFVDLKCVCVPERFIYCETSAECELGEVCATNGILGPVCLSASFVDTSSFDEVGGSAENTSEASPEPSPEFSPEPSLEFSI